METHLGKSPLSWNSELGEFISDDHAHMAKILQDYKPSLSLVYIPKRDRDASDTKPWAILDTPGDKRMAPHIVRYLSNRDMENPAAILAWVFEGDLAKHRPNDLLNKWEALEKAQKAMELQKQMEQRLDDIEHIEFLASGGRDKLHTIQLGKGRKIERA